MTGLWFAVLVAVVFWDNDIWDCRQGLREIFSLRRWPIEAIEDKTTWTPSTPKPDSPIQRVLPREIGEGMKTFNKVGMSANDLAASIGAMQQAISAAQATPPITVSGRPKLKLETVHPGQAGLDIIFNENMQKIEDYLCERAQDEDGIADNQ